MNLHTTPFKYIRFLISIIFILTAFIGCSQKQSQPAAFTSQDSIKIVQEILAHRSEVDSAFEHDPSSPFHRDSSIQFTGIKWFPPDIKYYFKSKLYRYEQPETVSIYGTKGEERKHLKYGYFILPFEEKEHRINVYKFTASDPARFIKYRNYLSVWFTDLTTGNQTYNVGRYVDVEEESSEPNHLYIINLNNAYNPYCAYTHLYSCAIPPKEDHLDFAVIAGEMKYHP
jgi:uncharacterized protein